MKIIARKNGTPINAVTTPTLISIAVADGTQPHRDVGGDQQRGAGQRAGSSTRAGS